MHAVLEIIDGPGAGKKTDLQAGQHQTLGRTEQADHAFPENLEMSSVHMLVYCGETSCHVRDLDSTNGTFVNGERVKEVELQTGDQLKAGQSVFSVFVERASSGPADAATQAGTPDTAPSMPVPQAMHAPPPTAPAPAPPSTTAPSPAPPPPSATASPTATSLPPATPMPPTGVSPTGVSPTGAPPAPQPAAPSPSPPAAAPADAHVMGFAVQKAADALDLKGLAPESLDIMQADQTPADYTMALMTAGQPMEAIRFLSRALTKPAAVAWAARCVREAMGADLTDDDQQALMVALTWVTDPSEEIRRQAELAAMKLEHGTPAAWVAMGAFLSGGSMGPDTAPVVPPPPHLTAHATSGAILMAAVVKEPEHADHKYGQFVQWGLEAGQPA